MRFQVIPAVYLVLTREHDGRVEVLLQFRRGTGYRDEHWACGAAGHIEAGESLYVAAAREAMEELGIAVALADLVPLTAMQRTHGNGLPIDERVDFFVRCERWAGEPALREPDKAADLRWFPLDALPHPMVPHELRVLAALERGDVPPILVEGF